MPHSRTVASARASLEPRHGEAPAGLHVVNKSGHTRAAGRSVREPAQPGPLNATKTRLTAIPAGSVASIYNEAVISSPSAISAGRARFLRRRHVTAGAPSANCGPRARRQALFAPRSQFGVLERHCCRAASGARAADGPAPGRLATVDLGSYDCGLRYPAELTSWTRLPSRQLPRHFPWPGSEYPITLEVPDVCQFCGVDRLQITCLRRSENPSAVTSETPKNGLEITSVRSGASSGSGVFLVVLADEF